MKKVDLVQTTILIVALLLGYSAIEAVISFLSLMGYYSEIFYASSGMHSPILSTLLIVLFLAGSCFILIKNARRYAEAILKNETEAAWDVTATVDLDRRNLIFVLLIGMGIYTLIQALPHLLLDLFGLFQNKVSYDAYKTKKTDSATIAIEFLKVTIGVFLIYAAPAISGFIDTKAGVKTEDGS
jgi:hypothetical protein